MSVVCNCDAGLGNLGLPSCIDKYGIVRKYIAVPLKDSTGALNSIDPSTQITPAILTANLNNTDTSKRWYVTPEIKNFSSEREDPEFEAFDDGSSEQLRQGVRGVSGLFKNADTTFLGKLEASGCVDFGVYFISDSGAIMGKYNSTDGFLYPVTVQNFYAKWQPKTDTQVEKTMFSFQYGTLERDCDLRFISKSDMTADLLNASGLIDVESVVNVTAAGAATVTLSASYGSIANKIKHTGVVVGDLSLFNVTQGAVVAGAAISETSDGVYALTWTAATAADVLRLTISKEGFDYATVTSNTFLEV